MQLDRRRLGDAAGDMVLCDRQIRLCTAKRKSGPPRDPSNREASVKQHLAVLTAVETSPTRESGDHTWLQQ